MHDEHPHPLLAQVPLTVSPFLNLPTATPLPYTYKQLPSTLPPSILSQHQQQPTNQTDPPVPQQQQPQQPPAYVVSATGTTAHPDSILASCLALQSHLQALESNARSTLQTWEDQRKAADLAEKRRLAPGWLDGDVKILKPENVEPAAEGQGKGQDVAMAEARPQIQQRHSVGIQGLMERRDGVPDSKEGEELDRAFGGMGIK